MNLDELKSNWQHYASSVSAQEKRSIDELDCLLPPHQPSYQFFSNTSFLIKNAAMFAFLVVFCGGC